MSGALDSISVGGVTPVLLEEENYPADEGTVVIDIDGSQFGPGDALNIRVFRIAPADTTIAPG